MIRIADAIKTSGLSRNNIYDKAKGGKIIARKNGKTTYIETMSLLGYIQTMPTLDGN